MDIRKALLKEHSKAQAQKIADYVGTDADRFDALMQLFLHDEYRVVQRAAWALSKCTDRYPNLILPYLEQLLHKMQETATHEAVRRNGLRVLQNIEIPAACHEDFIDYCFSILEGKEAAHATKVFAMQVAANLCQNHPGLKEALRMQIEFMLEEMPPPSIRSRGKAILAKL